MLWSAFGGLTVWFRPKVFRLEHLLDAEDEEVVRHLRAKGHELHWVLETRLREFQSDGWKPVTKWDKNGRRSIFMDNREEVVLLHSVPPRRIRYERSTSARRISRRDSSRLVREVRTRRPISKTEFNRTLWTPYSATRFA